MTAPLPWVDLARIALGMMRGLGQPAPPRIGPTAIVAVAVAVPAGFAAVVCLFVALWVWVRPLVGPAGAPLVVAAVLALVALLAVAVLMWTTRRPPAPIAPAPGVALDDVSRLVAAHKGPMLLAALLAGLVASGSAK